MNGKQCKCKIDSDSENLLNQNEVARILNVSQRTLEYWRWKGKGPKYLKLGKLVRYSESDVSMYIKGLR